MLTNKVLILYFYVIKPIILPLLCLKVTKLSNLDLTKKKMNLSFFYLGCSHETNFQYELTI